MCSFSKIAYDSPEMKMKGQRGIIVVNVGIEEVWLKIQQFSCRKMSSKNVICKMGIISSRPYWVYSVHNSKVINKMIDSPRQSWYLYVLGCLATQTRKELSLILLSISWNVVHVIIFNISNEICSWYCCILFWWDWITSSPEYMYTYSSGLLHSYWGHYVISPAPVK